MYSKESLEKLKEKINAIDVISSYVKLKRSGATYKALCPFHQEKTPSFIIKAGDSHFHCFGCGAHGDVIAFLMRYHNLSFVEALEQLAERFQVPLEKVGTTESEYKNKTSLREALKNACRFYQFCLLYTEEGRVALKYLFHRGIDLDFIKRFAIGYAPKREGILIEFLRRKGIHTSQLKEAGLIKESGREFFFERITFPIHDKMGHAIGFSARKFREETFGGKYINTPETPLFKKSSVLFGLHHSRKRIAKERKALLVEGQIDTLRLIQEGFDFAVAAQGTAFGEGHVRELLTLGIERAYLAFDGDEAGLEAAIKAGDLFQREGIDVFIVILPLGKDPDAFLCENGAEAFQKQIDGSLDYLTFLFQRKSEHRNLSSPAEKNQVVEAISKQIKEWKHPLMVHESLKKLSRLAGIPELFFDRKRIFTPKMPLEPISINPDQILETDLLRWIFLFGSQDPKIFKMAQVNLATEDLKHPECRKVYSICMQHVQQTESLDFLSLLTQLEDAQQILAEIMQKKINHLKIVQGITETIQKIKERNWMEKREAIKIKIHEGTLPEIRLLELAKEFDRLKTEKPKVIMPDE